MGQYRENPNSSRRVVDADPRAMPPLPMKPDYEPHVTMENNRAERQYIPADVAADLLRAGDASPISLGVTVVFAGICGYGAYESMIAVHNTGGSALFVTTTIVCLGFLIAAVYAIWRMLRDQARARFVVDHAKKMAQAEADAHTQQNRMDWQRHEVELHLMTTRAAYDANGNLPAFVGVDPRVISTFAPGQIPQQVPHTFTYNYKVEGGKTKDEPLAIDGAGTMAPTIAEIVNHVKRNSYELVLGRSLQTREFIIAEFIDAHIKLIGGSRMGKSCEAGAILEQARATHDPAHLAFSVLDLENKTGRLFDDDPHILTINTGYKKMKMHARDVPQVAEAIIVLHDHMIERYKISEKHGDEVLFKRHPHVLIYLEEFLYWKKLLSQFVSSQIREKALAAFAGIATRGIKVGLHLMACAQVDYADEELRDAMAQFLAINVAFSVKPSAAHAAGFVQTDLLNKNYRDRKRGQFVVESIAGSDIGVAPDYDVRAKLALLYSVSEEQEEALIEDSDIDTNDARNTPRNEPEPALRAKLLLCMENPGESMRDCIKRVWKVSPGDSSTYQQAKQEYIKVQEAINEMARRQMEGE